METIATWNICGIKNKEPEIVEFMMKRGISIMGVADVRKKEKNIKLIHNDFVEIWSGVEKRKRANHGIGFIVTPEIAKNITETGYVSERIVWIRVGGGARPSTVIQVYAPCNDSYSAEAKYEFFNELSDVISAVNQEDELFVMGDFNGRVGRRRTPWKRHLGPHSDNTSGANDNGLSVLELCAEHELFIANTFYEHRRSQKQTWYKWGDMTVSSQIDFILVRTRDRRCVTDSRVIPNVHVDTDHRPVVVEYSRRAKRRSEKRPSREVINLKKLEDEEIKMKVEKAMEEKFKERKECDGDVEEEWVDFRDSLINILKQECGVKRVGGKKRKATDWWNEDVKEACKVKKKAFKKWLKSRSVEDREEYVTARKACKRTVKLAIKQSWERYGEHLCEVSRVSPRDFFKHVSGLRSRDEPYVPMVGVNDANGTPIIGVEKTKERWREYFEGLLNPVGNNASSCLFTPRMPEVMEPNILESEVRRVVGKSAKFKAAGIDGITTEMVLACGEIGVRWLWKVFDAAWLQRKVPSDWQRSIIVPVWKKKGSKKDCGKYRGISLLSHVGKMYAKILECRVRAIVEHQLADAQFGFRPSRGCTDAIFALRQLGERAIEFEEDLMVAFIDQEKAFYRVERNKLWAVVEDYGVHGHLLDAIRALYENSKCMVRTDCGDTDWFMVTSGVRQGCVLSPLLFIIYMDRITREANKSETDLNELLFADDQSLIHDSEDHLQEHITALDECCTRYGMRISIEKTEVMCIGRDQKVVTTEIQGKRLKQVDEFKYLGSIFTQDGKMDREIETRVQKANQVLYQLAPLLQHRAIDMKTKRQLISAIFVPTLCYECQTWTLSKRNERMITSCEMKCLRKAASKTRRDRIRNEEIRRIVGVKPVMDHIDKQRAKWFGHLMRMPPNQPALRAYNVRGSGARSRGRPRRRWSDDMRAVFQDSGLDMFTATQLAKRRTLCISPRDTQ